MDVTDLTTELVSIPSHEDETAAGDHIAEWLRSETDADVDRDGDGNVIARRGDSEAPSLALVGHHDVVPPDDRQVHEDGYVVTERNGRLYGRGSADMKGAVAAAMCAFRDADPAGELVFASFVGEEDGGIGAQAAIERGFAPDFAVVGEGSTGYSAPGVTDVAVAHKGRRGSTIVAHGESGHASEPDAADNAIYHAMDAIRSIQQIDLPSEVVAGQRITGTLAVTQVHGGTAWNVVPDRCEVTVDERTIPKERAAIEQVQATPGVELRVDQDLPPMRCDDPGFQSTVLNVAGNAQDGDPEAVVKPHATDAGWLSQAGTECVVVGPAEPGEAHTDDESVSLSVLERCYEIYRGVAERVPGT